MKDTFIHLWDNGLIRALLGSVTLIWTVMQQSITNVEPSDQQWTLAGMAATAYFISASMRAGPPNQGPPGAPAA